MFIYDLVVFHSVDLMLSKLCFIAKVTHTKRSLSQTLQGLQQHGKNCWIISRRRVYVSIGGEIKNVSKLCNMQVEGQTINIFLCVIKHRVE